MHVNDLIEEIVVQEPDDSVGSKLLAAELFGFAHSNDIAARLSRINAAKQTRKPGIRDLPAAERRAYQAEAVRKHREKLKAQKAEGNPEPTRAAIREALADAALMLLAVDAPDADEVRAYLGNAFPGRAGMAMTVTSKARSGEFRPKSFKCR